MRNTLEDLYYGNITLGKQQIAPNSELKRTVKTQPAKTGITLCQTSFSFLTWNSRFASAVVVRIWPSSLLSVGEFCKFRLDKPSRRCYTHHCSNGLANIALFFNRLSQERIDWITLSPGTMCLG